MKSIFSIYLKFVGILSFTALAFNTIAQDYEEALLYNADLIKSDKPSSINGGFSSKSTHGDLDSSFIYITDTLDLQSPIFDDFSTNKFQVYEDDFNAPGIQEVQYFKLLDVSTNQPLNNDTFLTDSITVRIEVDLVNDTITNEELTPIQILYDPLTSYPVNHQTVDAYPPYIIIDSIDASGTTSDTIWLNDVPFTQDSARVFITEINDPNKIWLDRNAYHNYRFAKEPWSLGVVSFDGLDKNGYPYNFGSTTQMMCDTLTAKPFDLSGSSPADSVYFSFLYQTEGFGDAPEDDDSLIVEFYDPVEEEWSKVWRTEGKPGGDFKVGHIPLTNPNYFNNGFQFRFMNYCTPAGMLDHFHVDYVSFRRFSGREDTLFQDFAIVYPLSSLLNDYISVPWKHYKNTSNNLMTDELNVTVRNNSTTAENNQNGSVVINYNGQPEGSFTLNATTLSGGGINYDPRTTYQSSHDLTTGYEFDRTVNDSSAVFDWEANVSAQFPNFPPNDSTYGEQVFSNYYAYDDGSAEKAYGVFGTQSELAYKFNAYQADSLIGVQIHFTPTVNDVSNDLFLLAVWDDDNGQPGEKIYEDEFFFPKQPIYRTGRNKFQMYYFEDTMLVSVGETYYIGMRQINETRLNIGFDKNHNNQDKIFFSVDGGNSWQNANFEGSLMMRPIINSNLNFLLGVPEYKTEKRTYQVNMYPNPARTTVRVETDAPEVGNVDIYDMNGRLIKKSKTEEIIDVSSFDSGIYIVKIQLDQTTFETKKLVVQ